MIFFPHRREKRPHRPNSRDLKSPKKSAPGQVADTLFSETDSCPNPAVSGAANPRRKRKSVPISEHVVEAISRTGRQVRGSSRQSILATRSEQLHGNCRYCQGEHEPPGRPQAAVRRSVAERISLTALARLAGKSAEDAVAHHQIFFRASGYTKPTCRSWMAISGTSDRGARLCRARLTQGAFSTSGNFQKRVPRHSIVCAGQALRTTAGVACGHIYKISISLQDLKTGAPMSLASDTMRRSCGWVIREISIATTWVF